MGGGRNGHRSTGVLLVTLTWALFALPKLISTFYLLTAAAQFLVSNLLAACSQLFFSSKSISLGKGGFLHRGFHSEWEVQRWCRCRHNAPLDFSPSGMDISYHSLKQPLPRAVSSFPLIRSRRSIMMAQETQLQNI